MVRKFDRKGSVLVNPQFHDEFVALVALYFTGELTDEEWGLLQMHLAFCDDCRVRFEQYKLISLKVIPEMAASAALDEYDLPPESESAIAAAERRLMVGLEERPKAPAEAANGKPSRRMVAGVLAACAISAVALSSIFLIRHGSHSSPKPMQPIVADSAVSAVSHIEDKRELERARQEVANLKMQLAAAESHASQPQPVDLRLQHQVDTDHVEQQQLEAEREALSQHLAETQAEVESLREKLSASKTDADQQIARVSLLEAKVHDLDAALVESNTALDDKDRILAIDKDFLAHDRDIRELIGARDLYIADIFDTNEVGETAKPFGRIFYTKDRSLVFYGFDLDKQSGLKQSVAFQAWGSGSDKKPTSLGMFYQDDSNKRWVLRCNDATSLARMNMVFVTIEPPGGSAKPTGKQLLRAYLQVQPNHL